MRVSEYDAFGPWIYEIDEDHPLPPLFVPYVEHPETYRLLFKVPRDIERRKATPDMDLYDYVVGVDDSGIRVWSRREKAVETAYLPFREIGGIRLYQWLLKGVCSIYGCEGTITLPYNTVSADTFWKLLDMVRQTWLQEITASCGLERDTGLVEEQVDIWLYNQMRDLRDRGIPFAADAYQPYHSDFRTGRRFPWTKPEEFCGTLYLHNDRELLLLRSGKPEKKGEQKYSAEFTAIPWTALRNVSLEKSDRHEGTLIASFQLPGATLRTEADPGASAVVRYLKSLEAGIPIHP